MTQKTATGKVLVWAPKTAGLLAFTPKGIATMMAKGSEVTCAGCDTAFATCPECSALICECDDTAKMREPRLVYAATMYEPAEYVDRCSAC